MIIRVLFGGAAVLFGGYGVWLLASTVPLRSLGLLVLWLVAALVLHDAVWSPSLLGLGAVLSRVPARGRRYLQAGLVVAGCLAVVAVPLLLAQGRQPAVTTVLDRPIAADVALLLVLVASVTATVWGLRVLRDRRRTR